ncbi:MAG: glycosyltransferase [Candidatus Devosia phytovorans]|uniref:Glycosyltransferase n=1 Tax=Candidatus Devosia phytovorans TaxID=3121372 RepID=A0AAJ5VT22_9HYPH|nr:glycosyltransferase [Devosia sp.]WEK03646.1 MAG: glycosyltransferase [Devosia sp.]
MSDILFVHRHGPGQFVHLAGHLAKLGNRVTLLCETSDVAIPGVRVIKHRSINPSEFDGTAPAYQLRLGQEVAKVLDALRRAEGAPDVIMGHGGWGSLLFAKDIFPDTPLVAYCEFFYKAKGADIGFDPGVPTRFADIAKLKGRNFAQLATLPSVDAGVSPTQWQRSLFPKAAQANIGVVHDGIDLGFCRPDANARFTLPNGKVIAAGERVVTYAARNLEPYRGFPQFMRAAAALSRIDPTVTFLVAGSDGTSYGPGPAQGGSWRDVMMKETGMDPSRVHFLGTLPHAALIKLFQVSAAHVYLTYPFVLSWSMLEAMASGALIIGSRTAPVEEYVEHGRSGLLVPFFERDALVGAMRQALDNPAAMAPLRLGARNTIEKRAGLEDSLRRQVTSLRQLVGRRQLAV